MDAYVFVKEADQEALERMRGLVGKGGIRFVTSLSGPYDALVAIQADDLKRIESIVRDQIRGAGARWTETAFVIPPLPPPPPPPMPKWTPPETIEAFVTVHVEQGKAMAVLQAASEIRGFMGGAIIAGSFDLLLEFGGASFEDVAAILLSSLHTIEGIESTASYFAAFDRSSSAT